MAGLMVFKSLADALRAGFQIYDRTQDGYLVRTRYPSWRSEEHTSELQSP